MPEPSLKKCSFVGCGREGTRGFKTNAAGEVVCASERACAERSRRFFRGTPRGSRYLSGPIKGNRE
jgi:hypothetical protein